MQDGIVREDKTTINSSTVIDANIKAKEHLVINGKIKGNVEIKSFNLVLGPHGTLEGEVHAQNVRIRGHMRGDILAGGTVEIAKEANFLGKIKSKGISVEKGAYFEADVDLGRKSPDIKSQNESSTAKPAAKTA